VNANVRENDYVNDRAPLHEFTIKNKKQVVDTTCESHEKNSITATGFI